MSVYFDLVFDIPVKFPFDQSFVYLIDDKNEAAAGKRAMVPFRNRDILGYIIGERKELPSVIKEESVKKIRRVVDSEPVFSDKDVKLAEWIANYYFCGTGEALSAMLPSGKRAIYPDISVDEETEESLCASDEQTAALEAVIAAHKNIENGVKQNAPPMFYLYGITGSGKTEVFMRAAQYMLDKGKSVIYLVPEISLTHQTAQTIGKRFGSQAAAFHSGMSPSQRFSQWMRIRHNEVPIVVGPRSAVFAPVPNLGLIIIDEEHDGSYKSGNTPRYHARQVAHRRCSQEGAILLMGSATPSAEAWKLMQDGGIKRLDLSRRLSGGTLPEIKPVSLAGTQEWISKELKEEIKITSLMKKQTILFLNRRGYAHFYFCPDCLYELTCKRCSVSLTLHKEKDRCTCHYCGYSEKPPTACPNCGSLNAGYRGFGTEQIEEEIIKAFPNLIIRRVDADSVGEKSRPTGNAGSIGEKSHPTGNADSMGEKSRSTGDTDSTGKKSRSKNNILKSGSLEDTLNLFKTGVIDILLGTQMVAKGLNFPGVRLVGVVFADTGLHLPDFRAAERTFSLIVQVAGRAGRFFKDGKVIVQTMRPQDPVILRSSTLDVEGFYKDELIHRKALNFPPWSRIIRITIRSKEENRAETAINRLASFAKNRLPSGCDMLGPAECPISILNNNFRRHIIFRGQSMGPLHNAIHEILCLYEKGKDSKVYMEIDVDPVSML